MGSDEPEDVIYTAVISISYFLSWKNEDSDATLIRLIFNVACSIAQNSSKRNNDSISTYYNYNLLIYKHCDNCNFTTIWFSQRRESFCNSSLAENDTAQILCTKSFVWD